MWERVLSHRGVTCSKSGNIVYWLYLSYNLPKENITAVFKQITNKTNQPIKTWQYKDYKLTCFSYTSVIHCCTVKHSNRMQKHCNHNLLMNTGHVECRIGSNVVTLVKNKLIIYKDPYVAMWGPDYKKVNEKGRGNPLRIEIIILCKLDCPVASVRSWFQLSRLKRSVIGNCLLRYS